MSNLNIFAGFDVSKSYFDLSVLGSDKKAFTSQFSNNAQGFKALSAVLPADAHCVMEATGPYYMQLAMWLFNAGFRVSVINPLVIRRFAQMQLRRVKTDKADASLIAEYGRFTNPQTWRPPAAWQVQLQQLNALLQGATRTLTMLCNQMEAFSAGGNVVNEVARLHKAMIKSQEKYIKQIESSIDTIIKQYHYQLLKNLTSIPGIANKTAALLITITDGFTKFANGKQLSAYVGITPRIYTSGTSVKGKAPISKLGMERVRATLYLCAWSACKCNKSCRELYERLLKKGKAKMVALVAVAHKLLRQAFAVATQNKPYLIQP
jgi:transposase